MPVNICAEVQNSQFTLYSGKQSTNFFLQAQKQQQMKAIFVLVFIALFAYCAHATEAEIEWQNVFTQKNIDAAYQIYKLLKTKKQPVQDAEMADIDWSKVLTKNNIDTALQLYKLYKETQKEESDMDGLEEEADQLSSWLTEKNIDTAYQIYKLIKGNPVDSQPTVAPTQTAPKKEDDDEESDIEWSNLLTEKNIDTAYQIFQLLKNNQQTNETAPATTDDDDDSESDESFFKKLKSWFSGKPKKPVTPKEPVVEQAPAVESPEALADSEGTCDVAVQFIRDQLKTGTQTPVEDLVAQKFPKDKIVKVAAGIRAGLPSELLCKQFVTSY